MRLIPALLPFLLASLVVAQDIAIVGGTIEVGNGEVIEGGTVLIRDGVIVEVGADVDVPDGYATFDATGKHVYPGFIDCYSTEGAKLPDVEEGPEPPEMTTDARYEMWWLNRKGIRPAADVSEYLALADGLGDFQEQGITTALIATGLSGGMRGQPALVELIGEGIVITPRFAQELSLNGGGGGGGYPGNVLGYMALLRQTLYDAIAWAENPDLFKYEPPKEEATEEEGEEAEEEEEEAEEKIPFAPVADYEVLQALLDGDQTALIFAESAVDIERALETAAEFDLSLRLAGAQEAYRVIDLIRGIPICVDPDVGSAPDIEGSEDPVEALDDPPVAVRQERYDEWLRDAQNAQKLTEAGVEYGFCNIELESLRQLIELGLPRDAALSALTIGGARNLGLEGVGQIQEGFKGNIVIFSGDFADEESEVEAVFINGKRADTEEEGR